MANEVNEPMSEAYRRAEHHSWAEGFYIKTRAGKQYHPYTRKDFKFKQ